MDMRPVARSRRLVVEPLGEELLVFDRDSNRVHSLNMPAAAVWQACDGTRDRGELAKHCSLDLDAVNLALDSLAACELLDGTTAPATPTVSRRAVLRRAVLTGASVGVAIPVIRSITAPSAALAASNCVEFGDACTGQSCCDTGGACTGSGVCRDNLSSINSHHGSCSNTVQCFYPKQCVDSTCQSI